MDLKENVSHIYLQSFLIVNKRLCTKKDYLDLTDSLSIYLNQLIGKFDDVPVTGYGKKPLTIKFSYWLYSRWFDLKEILFTICTIWLLNYHIVNAHNWNKLILDDRLCYTHLMFNDLHTKIFTNHALKCLFLKT